MNTTITNLRQKTMQPLIAILIASLPLIAFSQGNKQPQIIDFRIETIPLETGGIQILKSEFRQEFKINDQQYCIEIINDSTSVFSLYNSSQWQVIDSISLILFIVDTNRMITPEFTIQDFNNDGFDDFLCWPFTDIHGNQWTFIYLYDPSTSRIVKLFNHAEKTFIWDNPNYDTTKQQISCELLSGVLGTHIESTYYLKGLIAEPLEKTIIENSMSGETIISKERHYKGKNGHWKRISKHEYQE